MKKLSMKVDSLDRCECGWGRGGDVDTAGCEHNTDAVVTTEGGFVTSATEGTFSGRM